MEYLTRIDEGKCWNQMPTFVALNLSRISIISIEDVETFIMAQKIEQMEARLRKVEVDNFTLSKERCNNAASQDQPKTLELVVKRNLSSGGDTDTNQCSGDEEHPFQEPGKGESVYIDTDVNSWTKVVRRAPKKPTGPLKLVGCNKLSTSKLKAARIIRKKFI